MGGHSFALSPFFPSRILAAIRTKTRSRSKSLDTGLCASAYYSAIRGCQISSSTNRAPLRGEPLLMAIILLHIETVHETLSDAIYYLAARAAFRSS
jgi:hypothetical protein